jgi:uncharacterized membrane protein YdjX (TVP38/TMEM64 family)
VTESGHPHPHGHEHVHPPPGSLRRAGLRFAILLLLLAASFALVEWTPLGDYLSAEHLKSALAGLRGTWWSPIALILATTVLGALGVPATPFLIAGAAIFGALWGTFWNWVAITCASAAGYLLARALGREFVERIGGGRLRRAEKILHRRGFMPLVAIRFVPIPFSLVNAAAAVVGVRFGKFLIASAFGYFPPIAIITYFTAAILQAASGDRAAIARELLLTSTGAALLVFTPIGVRRYLRRKRLRELRAHRSTRNGPAPRLPR